MRKPAFCICENKDADQLRGNREADQRLCFRYMDSTIPLLPKSEISSLQTSSVAVQPGLCWNRSVFSQRGSIIISTLFTRSHIATTMLKKNHFTKTIKIYFLFDFLPPREGL